MSLFKLKPGLREKRCVEDEKMLKLIGDPMDSSTFEENLNLI